MHTPNTSPFLHAVEEVLSKAQGISLLSPAMPPGLPNALSNLQTQFLGLTNFQKSPYITDAELQRQDWAIVLSGLRQASRDLMAAQGTQQEPSWLRPYMKIAEEHAQPLRDVRSEVSANDEDAEQLSRSMP